MSDYTLEKKAETYERRMGKVMVNLGTIASDWSWGGSCVELRDANGRASGKCQLCGHDPIAEGFDLVTKQGQKLLVGSECIINYMEAKTEKLQQIHETKMAFRSRHKQVQLLMVQCNVDYQIALKFWIKHEGTWRVWRTKGKSRIDYKAEDNLVICGRSTGRPYFYQPVHFDAIEEAGQDG